MLIECETESQHIRAPDAGRANLLGVGIHPINISGAVDAIDWAIRRNERGYVCVTGVHGVMEAHRDFAFRSILNNAYLIVPDGMPAVWVGRLQGHAGMDRVFGPDLMLAVCELSQSRGYKHFLYGGVHGVADTLKRVLEARFPGLEIVGTFTPPFRDLQPDEEVQLVASITRLKPQVIWVGLSTPKQERFMAEYLHKLDTTIMIGVGAAFDLHTGRINDAPNWIKRAGLQWMHRLGQEPRRLWKRYLFNNSIFLYQIALQLLGVRTFQSAATVPFSANQQFDSELRLCNETNRRMSHGYFGVGDLA